MRKCRGGWWMGVKAKGQGQNLKTKADCGIIIAIARSVSWAESHVLRVCGKGWPSDVISSNFIRTAELRLRFHLWDKKTKWNKPCLKSNVMSTLCIWNSVGTLWCRVQFQILTVFSFLIRPTASAAAITQLPSTVDKALLTFCLYFTKARFVFPLLNNL